MNTNESIMGAFTLGYYYALRTERKFKQCRATFQQLEDFARAVDEYEDAEPREDCHYCGGEGYGDYQDFNEDPLWVGFDTTIPCPCCKGSGAAKDETFW